MYVFILYYVTLFTLHYLILHYIPSFSRLFSHVLLSCHISRLIFSYPALSYLIKTLSCPISYLEPKTLTPPPPLHPGMQVSAWALKASSPVEIRSLLGAGFPLHQRAFLPSADDRNPAWDPKLWELWLSIYIYVARTFRVYLGIILA